MSLKLYTLKSCDTCKKALKWLDDENISFQNHDIRTDGLERNDVVGIVNQLGADKAVNRRSTTWRNLSQEDKSDLDNDKAITLIIDNPTLLKRPVFMFDDTIICGFNAESKAIIQTRL